MNKQFFIDTIKWGFLLWLLGYALGIILFPFVPIALIGWIIMPIGTVFTVWVLLKKITGPSLRQYILVSCVWTAIAVIGDYLFLVKMFHPADGYYKADVYLYYVLIFLLPPVIGWKKLK